MRWQQLEYIAKGVFLGLVLFVALQQPAGTDVEKFLLCLLGGLALGLAGGAVGAVRQGFQIKGRVLPFVLFLVLEHPLLTYGGILLGAVTGVLLVQRTVTEAWLLPTLLVGGVVLGVIFPYVRLVKHPIARSA